VIERVPTGIPEFDALIEGGFPRSSVALLAGNPELGRHVSQ